MLYDEQTPLSFIKNPFIEYAYLNNCTNKGGVDTN